MTIRPTVWRKRGSLLLVFAAALAIASVQVAAQAPYPNKPIRIIVPYPPGAGTDFTGREIGARAAPDGYTLLLGTTGGLVSGPALLGSKIPYDPLKDFATIGLATYVPYAIAVTASLPANNVKELIDLARASPRKLNVASPGVGTPNHLGAAQLMTLTGIEIVHVPYKGTALAINDLVAGNVQMIVTGLLQLLPLHQAGRVRILGVGHTSRLKAFPDIPTVAETVPGYYNTGWWGIVAPANTPKPIIDKLNAIMTRELKTPEIFQRFEKNGLEIATSTPREYHELIASDLQMWKKLIKDAKISVDVLP